ncbi:primosomal protein N' [Rhodospirillum sp. A1_3_36]|uniref:primosomal protein N' n=1 Tax=Rhodospirillum sp. A1_3_36 TaxID=3391666 RepID=UPI0039A6D9C3
MAIAPASPRLPLFSERRVSVLLPLPLAGAYDYLVPEGMEEPPPGTLARVPLGRREVVGVVLGPGEGEVEAARLKPLNAVLPLPPLPPSLLALVDWVAAYTVQPRGAVLRMALSVPDALEPPSGTPAWVATPGVEGDTLRLTAARKRVLAVLADHGAMPFATADLAREAAVSPSVITAMGKAGLLHSLTLSREWEPPRPDPDQAGFPLSEEQGAAASRLRSLVSGGFSTTLLDGVTGSGKTEVYFEAMAECLRLGRQVLVLLPEIALAAQWPDRFAARFGVEPVQWHSQMGQAGRKKAWRAVALGRAQVVVGARSALFLPFPDLGLIVVDEEHDSAFKQEDGVTYNARDMAVVRGRLGAFPVVLASATPSLETIENARQGRYGHILLPSRHGGASLPRIELIDLRRHKPEKWQPEPVIVEGGAKVEDGAKDGVVDGNGAASGVQAKSVVRHEQARMGWLSPPLIQATREALAAGEQVLLYLNRRGYAPLTLCRTCGHRLQCPRCTAWLVEHRRTRRLQCHHCDFQMPLPDTCPSCEAPDSLAPCGPGVERLAEEALFRFPEAHLEVAASDTLPGPKEARAMAERVRSGAVNLIVGTQIMAKGHHFPALTLVGVVDGDLGLSGGDLRAAERTHQLLHQVAGRAGRADRPGRVLIQTVDPGHPVMEALATGDADRFIDTETEERRALCWPPHGRLVALIVSSTDPAAAQAAARALGRTAPLAAGVDVLGPAPAPLSMLRGRHRHRLLLKAEKGVRVQGMVAEWLSRTPIPSSVKVQVDVDPLSFL